VATGISGPTNPRAFGDDVYNRLRLAAESGGTTFFGTGIEPGYMCVALALSLSSISRDISSIRAQECLSYATYDQPNYHVSRGGIWGAPCDPSYADAFADHILAAGMGGPVLLLAEALGVTLDDLTAVVDLAAASEDFEVPMGPIGKGTVAGYRFELLGIVGGAARIAVEHITRIHPDVAPHWPSVGPGGFRVVVEGTPSFTARSRLRRGRSDHRGLCRYGGESRELNPGRVCRTVGRLLISRSPHDQRRGIVRLKDPVAQSVSAPSRAQSRPRAPCGGRSR
jgi:4-hydroxy-tetrahydrodipicolinate reductase